MASWITRALWFVAASVAVPAVAQEGAESQQGATSLETSVAQEQEGTTVIIEPAPGTATFGVSAVHPPDGRLEYLRLRSKRTRAALIATSVTTAIGIGLFAGGVSQCDTLDRPGTDDIVCNNTGDVLTALGGGLMFSGAIGMLVSGIMLGVRNGRIREYRYLQSVYPQRSFRWEPQKGAFVF